MAAEIARPLSGLKALVIGIANDQSIAYGCARAFRRQGAELAITYLNHKARPYVEPLARELEAPIFLPLDVRQSDQLEAVFEEIRRVWGRLDIALHSIAFAPKEDLQGASSTARSTVFSWRPTTRATRSSAWPGWRPR
jgi:enoyl-[acyl-carrier protein] reductase I